MMKSPLHLVPLVLGCLLQGVPLQAADPVAPASFQELYDLIRTNLPGVDDAAMQRAAVEGLLSRFAGRVSLGAAPGTGPSTSETTPAVQARVIEDRFAYVRVARVEASVAEPLVKALTQLAATNRLLGGVVDLRFASGNDFESALTLASLWVQGKRPLLDWGKGMRASEGVNPAGTIPWVVLVNSRTTGAPEAIAAAMRQTETALVVGATTAGQAAVGREFTLRNGQRLTIASQAVMTADGKPIPASGVAPDIEVRVDPEQERLVVEEGGRGSGRAGATVPELARKGSISGVATNRSGRRRLNEADLVRMQKEGRRTDGELSSTAVEPGAVVENPVAGQDPSLGRALDLLKGLSVVRRARGG
jgi:hypothetical protein